MSIQNKHTFLFLLLFGTSSLFSQEKTSYWDVNYAYGSVLKHKKTVGHLVTAHPELYSLSWYNTAKVNSWKKNYNYPDWGLTFISQHFNNSVLGNVYALNYGNKFYLLERNRKNQLNLGMGLGLGYCTNPLDFETNNQNVAISSPISFSVHLKLNYEYQNLYKGVGVSSGIFLSHFSNSSFKLPNFGVNSIFINAGLSYRPTLPPPSSFPKRVKAEEISKQPITLNLGLEASIHELKAGLGTKPILLFQIVANKRISRKNGLSLGTEYFHSWANKEFADFLYHTQTEIEDRTLKDFKQISIFVGHKLLFNRWSFNTNIGYYLYNPLKKTPKVYQKLGFDYRIKDSRFSTGFAIKVHNFRADHTSLGIKYQLL
jgi:hypothetical protein